MGTDPSKTAAAAAGAAADASAESAEQAAQSATDAEVSADRALRAAVAAEVAAALVPVLEDLSLLKAADARLRAADAKLAADEVKDDEEAHAVEHTVLNLQSQWLWICAACVMFGAGLFYVLSRLF